MKYFLAPVYVRSTCKRYESSRENKQGDYKQRNKGLVRITEEGFDEILELDKKHNEKIADILKRDRNKIENIKNQSVKPSHKYC